jgi:cell wall-associated NlpC family hydrolase
MNIPGKTIMKNICLMICSLLIWTASSQAAGRVTLIEQLEKSLALDKAFSAQEREQYLKEFRQQLGSYAFDILKGQRNKGLDVLLSIVTEGSFDGVKIERTVGVATAAYVAIRRGSQPKAVAGIALYGFRKKLSTDKIEAWANGYRDCTRFKVPAAVAEELIYNAAENDWDIDTFNKFKWGLVQAAKAEYDTRQFAIYMLGHYKKGGSRPGEMISKSLRAFSNAAQTGAKVKLPRYQSPILQVEPKPKQPDPKQPDPKQPDPKQPDPKQPDPKQPDPKQPDPKQPDPKQPDPKRPPTKDRHAKIIASLAESIRTFIKTPYVWGGRSRRGTDCSGFVQTVFAEAGIKLPRSSKQQWTSGTKVARDKLKKGDLVFFVTIGNRISHVGVVTDPAQDQFAHASSSRGVVYSDLKSKYYRLRYAGARRVIRR